MGKSDIASWEETVFEHRNREYGAYILRYNYPCYLTVSALIVLFLFLSGIVGLKIFSNKRTQVQEIKTVRVIKYNELSAPPPIERTYVPPKQVVMEQAKVEKYVAPVVTQEEVEEPEEMMTIEEVKENLASTDNSIEASDGEGDVIIEAAPPVEEVVVVEEEPVFTGRPPEFPGGEAEMSKWLKANLKYPPEAERMGVEGKVVVVFFVDESGRTCDATVKESLHRSCDREAIRLVKSMPAWIPGEENGVKIRVKYTLTVPFVL